MKAIHGLFAALIWSALPHAHAAGWEESLAKANAGDVAAQVEVAESYAKGKGVARDMKQAVTWFTKAAEQGNTDAQMKLGALYLGGKGLPKDGMESAKWYGMAAAAGVPAAQLQVARMHLAGTGVPKDDVEAYKWATLANAGGEKQARAVISLVRQRMNAAQIAKGETMVADFLAAKKLSETPIDTGVPKVAPPLEE
jgi:TPR repeat protein